MEEKILWPDSQREKEKSRRSKERRRPNDELDPMKNDSMRIKVIMDHLMGLLAIEKETSLKFININKFKEENI